MGLEYDEEGFTFYGRWENDKFIERGQSEIYIAIKDCRAIGNDIIKKKKNFEKSKLINEIINSRNNSDYLKKNNFAVSTKDSLDFTVEYNKDSDNYVGFANDKENSNKLTQYGYFSKEYELVKGVYINYERRTKTYMEYDPDTKKRVGYLTTLEDKKDNMFSCAGEMKDLEEFEGRVKQFYDGIYIYEGYVKDDKFNGLGGILNTELKSTMYGRWENGDIKGKIYCNDLHFSVSNKLKGNFYNLNEGKGTIICHYPTKLSYTGDIKENKPDGEGRIDFLKGESFTGTFKNGYPCDGKYINGETVMIGHFENLKLHGKCILKENNYYFEGDFVHGEIKGYGEERCPEYTYEGEFQRSKPNGLGKLELISTDPKAKKKILSGKFVNGEFEEQGKRKHKEEVDEIDEENIVYFGLPYFEI